MFGYTYLNCLRLFVSHMSQYPFGTLGKEVLGRVDDNLDCKIVVTSYSSTPGLGKTTLAIQMARQWDRHGWSAEEKSFMQYEGFYNKYMDAPPGTVLLFDEVENEADARRANSGKNVGLSQLLATQRVRNIISIYTLPAVSMLDKRIMELADYWINVGVSYQKGVAYPHRLQVNDYSWVSGGTQVTPRRLGDDEIIRFNDLPDDDPDKTFLDELKDEQNHLESEYIPESEADRRVKKAEKQARRDYRDDVIQCLYNDDELDLSSYDIAELDVIDLSQQRVSQIANGD